MKIIVAKNSGFCPGVKNAIDKVLELSKTFNEKIYTLGPMIHNKEVIKSLEEKNIYSIENISEIKEENAILVIRAHGIAPELEKEIRSKKLRIIDGTCPLVKNVHKIIEKYAKQNYTTIIVGDDGHAEVIGLKGYAGKNCFVVKDLEEAKKIPKIEKANLVSQTTQEEKNFLEIANELSKNIKELIISNTICEPTKLRQRETYEFSKNVEFVIVVGGKHSANTQRLFKICSNLSQKAILIENPKELKSEDLKDINSIFITAGASTPNWLIDATYKKIKELNESNKNIIIKKINLIWRFLIVSGIYTGLSASFLTLFASKLLGISYLPKKLLFISSSFILSLHVLNRAIDKNSDSLDEIKKIIFIKFAFTSKLLAYIFGILALIISLTLNLKVFIYISLFWLLALIYTYKLSKFFQKIKGSKDIIMALGWTLFCALLPYISIEGNNFNKLILISSLVFFLTMQRYILLTITQEHNDLMLGKENIYKALGFKKTEYFLYFILLFSTLIFTSLYYNKKYYLLFLLSFLYYPLILNIFKKGKIPDKINSEAFIDFSFFILGSLSMFI